MSKWYIGEGDHNDIVISTRIRIARNLADYPFPVRLDNKSKIEVNEKIRDALDGKENLTYTELKTLTRSQIVSLAERHLISPEFASNSDARALLMSDNEDISIMLCEEDHIRIQVMKSGLALKEAYELADKIDTEINQSLKYAFDEKLGYLTQCPANLGTGMRASVMLHLPALTAKGQIGSLASTVSKLGLTIRGAYGEGMSAMGDLYQLSNQVSLGISEKSAIDNLKTITLQLAAQERAAREETSKSIETEDAVFRAYGILKSARILSTKEFMSLISKVRLGAVLGMIKTDLKTINELMVSMQPATINAFVGKTLSLEERDVERAKIVRERL
ncbi:MAG: protein arginine kinase [Ruminococcus sp.]|nr:protein arginine kinase [Oscillospiraceae bacterium]MDD6271593.1 protein arginine kinase [Ruminococcus sp.]MDD7345156.1 protein arginine kinase [Ruminococcus sp.]MDY6060214.1 protein arginine kinase [Candidatus Fimenecus sp.]